MGKALFLNVSGGGHVIATYGLVGELVRRGEEVIYYEAPQYREDLEALGATFLPTPPFRHYTGPLTRDRFHHELDLAPILTWWAMEWIPQLLGPIREMKPDYIVHDSLCVWGKAIARIVGIPAVCSIHTPAFSWRVALASGRFRRDMPSMFRTSFRAMRGFRSIERELRRTWSLPRTSYMDTLTNRQPVNICHTPRELQPHDDLLDDSYHFIASVHTRPTQGRGSFPLDRLREPRIYIGFGTICDPGPGFFRNCVAAFRGLEHQVVMILSASTKRSDLGEIPENFLVWSLAEDGMAPQLDILPRTSLFVMNGGMGGAREAAWHGVPMLAVGTTFETHMISERIEKQGAGIHLPPAVAPDELRAAALRVLSDPSYRTNSARIGEACRAAGGAVRGADIILDYVGERRRGHA
jgi:MGT family glycosyltransferase